MKKSYSLNDENGYITSRNVAGKNPAVSALQDLLFYQLTGLSFFAKRTLLMNKTDKITNSILSKLLYLTNKGINFNISTMMNAINEAYKMRNRVNNLYKLIQKTTNQKLEKIPNSAKFKPLETLSQMVSQANIINAQKSILITNINIYAIQEIIKQSLCSVANYLEHIKQLETIPQNVYVSLYDILDFLNKEGSSLSECTHFALRVGELQTQVLELLISSYEKTYGFIEKRKVPTNYKKGAAILVVGEDFAFLKNLLEATQDKDIDIYTYGTMNYAHVLPELKKYKNLFGIYVGKYYDMAANIEVFPGVTVLTRGNLEDLTDIYRGRIFSVEDISMLGVKKLNPDDLKPLINAAYDAPGFEEDEINNPLEMGFSLNELEYYTNKIFSMINNKKVQNILIFLGCNYFADDKNYLRKMLKLLPKNNVVITLGCLSLKLDKNKQNLPLVLNFGQYINLFNFIRLLFALAGKFRKDINEIPLYITINLKTTDSIAALLMFLSLGIKNIKINSDLPNYMSESLLKCFPYLSKVTDAMQDSKNISPKRA